MYRKILLSQYERPYYFTHPPPPPPPPPATTNSESPHGFNLNNKVSPSVLLIIIILAIIFFISGLLHLLVRFLIRPSTRDPDEFDNVTALQGQLQQLFHLHDSGVDQSFIDTLPVFTYKSIIGVKNPFDCAVCLCEFEGEDKLRLLPKCSHAFHMECIDTWLLSHSTCPLCRNSLLSDFSPNTCCSPIVLVLESGSNENSREIVSEPTYNSIQREGSHLSNSHYDEEFEFSQMDLPSKPDESEGKEEEGKEKVVTIKLGKFKNVDNGGGGGGGGGEGSSEKNTIDGRRCFSMGSFEYVMDEDSSLQVPIRSQIKKEASKKSSLPITPGHRPARSECGGDSRRDFIGLEAFRSINISAIGGNGGSNAIGRSKRESFSVSKIWLRGKKEKPNSTVAATIEPSSRGSFSFRFPLNRSVIADELKAKNGGNRRAISEVDIGRWEENGGGSGELGCGDEEITSCHSLDSQTIASNPPSFARRTLLWFLGRQQNKVVHSSFSPNV